MHAVQEGAQHEPQAPAWRLARLVGAFALAAIGLILLFAGLAAGDGGGLLLAVPFLLGAYWLYSRK
jgi:hypothetical protein